MAFTAVTGQKTSATDMASATTHSKTYAATPLQYNLMTLQCSSDAVTTFTKPTGWDGGVQVNNAAGTVAIFYKVAGAGESTTVTFTQSAAGLADMTINEWSGGITASILDASGTVTDGTAHTTLSIPTSGPTTLADELALVALVTGGADGGSLTWGSSGFATDFDTTGGGFGSKALNATATITATPNWSSALTSAGVIVTFKALVASQLPILGMY